MELVRDMIEATIAMIVVIFVISVFTLGVKTLADDVHSHVYGYTDDVQHIHHYEKGDSK